MRLFAVTLLLLFGYLLPAQAQNALEQCKQHIEQGEFDAARESGELAVKQHPNDPDAHRYLGLVYTHQGIQASAQEHLDKAQQLYTAKRDAAAPNSPARKEIEKNLAWTYHWLGDVYALNVNKSSDEAIKNYDLAIQAFAALNDKSDQAEMIGYKANVYSDIGDLPQALELYNQALDLVKNDKSKHPEIKIGLAWLNFKLERAAKAVELAEQAIKETDKLDDKAYYRMTEGYFLLRQVQDGTKSSKDIWDNYLLKGLTELRDANDKVRPGFNKRYEAIGLRYAGDITMADALAAKNAQTMPKLLALAKQRYLRSRDRADEIGARQELDTCYARLDEVEAYLDRGAKEASSRYYGAIDIGATGIKPSLVELQLGGNRKASPQIIADDRNDQDKKDDNWNVITAAKDGVIPDDKIEQAKRAVRNQTVWMAGKCANPEQITIAIAGSSSLAGFTNLDALKAALLDVTQALKPRIEFIDSRRELLYDCIGVLPEDQRYEAILLDIGSGNGRFGWLDTGRENIIVQNFDLGYGTKTLDQKVTGATHPGEKYTDVLDSLLLAEMDKSVGKTANQAVARKKKSIYLTGGIAWALTTFLHPERVNEPYVKLSRDDFAAFYQMVSQAGNTYPAVDYSKVPLILLDSAKKEAADVQKVFKPAQLLAGAGMLKHLAEDQLFSRENIVFARNRGWSLGLAESTYAARR